jgi:Rrf2 family nitric oxide-sensitive transcriptional repressor
MRLKLQTDYGLRVLIFLAHADRLATVEEIATAFGISRHHLLKVANALSRQGWIQTVRGRGGGILLKADPAILDVGDVVGRLEGRNGVLECVEAPDVCRLEPGCRLRRRLMVAERAFYDALHGTTLADLVRRPGADHGLTTLVDGSASN